MCLQLLCYSNSKVISYFNPCIPCVQVDLFIVDELHLIGGQSGPVLEVITSRMRYMAAHLASATKGPGAGGAKAKKVRIVALSASLANARDLGEWLGAGSHGLFNFAPSVRPVPLEIHIQGIDIANFEARMQVSTGSLGNEVPLGP